VQQKLERSTAKQSFLKASSEWGECLRRLAAATASDKVALDVLTIKAVQQCGTHESALAQAFVDARASEGLPTTVEEREEFRQTMRELAVQNLISSR
jgi:hypothetical protein